ncbi:Peptidoglycan-binding lysin domain-containing protein [Gemmatirosa kalamazoonensis]|uniref:Peptidoglycan-binding lysin domain-containing protein n=1 Tax=Gemmatirosa kalamazoonensis TaxID=861299 RepID=W0RCH8_9BACT|nr:LysM domain-containing protein [Gemmatirosa kalamazoonensis]AHG88799.1 Peptidoglycan-binding lysin domain-containing protein [Gemmatirosa kalamazoonensis]
MSIDKKWQATVDGGITDAAWDEYDQTIQSAVATYNQKFAGTAQFQAVDWRWVKAMLWTESGGPTNESWKTRPLQIGNAGDPAFRVLQTGAEGSTEVMEADLFQALKAGRINEPAINVRAAVAYLFTRLAKFAEQSVLDPTDKTVREYTVAPGDTLWSIARRLGTTQEELQDSNPAARGGIKPKQVLKYRKAAKKLVIVGWRPATAGEIAARYNGGGDAAYAEKLTYVKDELFPKLVRKNAAVVP